MRKRILSLLLCVVMLFSLCPQSALAEGTDGEMAIQLGTKAIKDPVATQNGNGKYYTPASYVYFGNNSSSSTPIKWRVLDADKNNAGSDGMFLLSEYLLASGIQFESAWNSNDQDGQTNPNEWQHSDAQKWCSDNLSTYFSMQEQSGMLGVNKNDQAVDSLYSLNWEKSSLSNEKLFFLSVQELADYVGNYNRAPGLSAQDGENGSAGVWWLRSPSAISNYISGVVYDDGVVNINLVNNDWAARPAFNINLNSVLFTSAAEDGKISAAFGGGSGGEAAGSISKISTTTTNEWKFTLKDDTRNSFNAKLSGSSTVTPGESISIEYSGATTGNNEYVSAMLTDASGNALYYGRLVNTSDAASGTVSMAIPADLAAGSYTLKVFSEQYNGDKQTDYASTFKNINLTVGYKEQFSLAPGSTYYFDLSGENIPGTANSGNPYGAASLPDTSLHYVPFTYAGTVEAYKLTSAMATTEEYAEQNKYAHSLFVAAYAVTHTVSWDDLNTAGLIFGKNYASDGVDYTLRAPSEGSYYTGSGDPERGTPQSNEWDMMLGKNEDYIKNWNYMGSWGQDTSSKYSDHCATRGYNSARYWYYPSPFTQSATLGFRPVLEVLNADTLGADGLKAVTLDLNGGKLGGSADDIQIIVKNGAAFTAPASDGLTRPDGDAGSFFIWKGSDGNLYVPGDSVPADVTTLTAQWTPKTYIVTFDPNGGSGMMAPQTFTEGVAQNLTLNTFIREGFTFIGWNTMADGSGTSFADGASVTASSNATLYAQWKAVPVVTPLTITKQPTDQFVVEGQRAEFSVEAAGDGLTYQWYINRNDGRGWRELDGAIGTAYVTSVTDLECDGFQYGCLITDQYGNTLKSDVAVLHVSKVPVLPETGDSSTPMLWLAMSILSMAGILLLRKKAYSR